MEDKHLRQHLTDAHTKERDFVCEVPGCTKAFSTSSRLKRHVDTVHALDKPGFKCVGYDSCNASFRKRSALERHVRKDHLGMSPYLCMEPNCGATYDSAGALRNHKDRDHGELKFWCELCGQEGSGTQVGFSIKSQLQNHMRKEHLNCVFCGFTSSSKHDLAKHVEMEHTDNTESANREHVRIQCNWEGCEKWFTKRSNLNVHIRSAHEGKRFVCGEVDISRAADLTHWNSGGEGCGKQFSSKANLEDHVRYVHLHLPRPSNTRANRAKRDTTAPLDEISGAKDAAKRKLACPVAGCKFKFIRNHDLQRHLDTYSHEGVPDSVNHAATPKSDGARVAPTASMTSSGTVSSTADSVPSLPTSVAYNAAGDLDLGGGSSYPDPDVQFGVLNQTQQDSQPVRLNSDLENTEHDDTASMNTGGIRFGSVPPFTNPQYYDPADTFGNFDFATGNAYQTPQAQYSQPPQEGHAGSFNTGMENAEIAQQLVAGVNNAQGTLVGA